ALVELAHGERQLVWEFDAAGNRVGAALDSRAASEFVVDPDARGHGHGARMLDMLTHPARGGAGGSKLFWAHGDHPASRALARHHKLEAVRTLLHLRLENLPAGSPGGDAFTPADADAWLALNARTFASHPEQGAITRADLETTMAEPWFDPADLLLLHRDGALIGYVWLKVHARTAATSLRDASEPASAAPAKDGEFYVVGVDPAHQHEGLGRLLMAAGFARLAERGIHTAHLYVEADNEAAVRLYRELGFVDASVDIQYHYTR
ncbi:MAG: mycothiol synthase, partial [Rhodoglobus sp.]